MKPIVEQTVELAGTTTRTLSVEGGSPAFLLVHGFGDSADTWRRILRRLGEAGHRAVAVDLPSHGHASSLDRERPVVDQLVEFAEAAARHAGAGTPAIAVGNSLGGTTVLLLGERRPDSVAGVVAIAPAALEHPRWMATLGRRARLRSRASPFARRQVALPGFVTGAAAAAVVGALAFGRPWRAPRGWITAMGRGLTPARRRDLARLAFRLPDEVLSAGGPYDFAALRRPVLVLWGDRDRLALASGARRLLEEVENVRHVPLLGIGHLPQVEAPGRVTKHLLEFAAEVAPADARFE